jgi:uncharacterized repeat protein (TIGR03803 family)
MKKAIITFASLALACALAQAAGGNTWKYELLHSFNPAVDGAAPIAGLIEQGGAFWGTTSLSGPGEGARGTVFKFVPGSKPVVMHTFRGRDGANPKSELLAVGSYLYGTLEGGLVSDQGGVFRISTLGTFKVMNAFSAAEGTKPIAPLMRATDGNFYGTTKWDGPNGRGSVFRMTPAGEVTVIHSAFESGYVSNKGPLVQHANGFLYGTTDGEGVHSGGSVFRVSMSGIYQLVHSFHMPGGIGGDPQGCQPIAGLTFLANGNLAGVASNCGGGGAFGTVYQVGPFGPVNLLHALVDSVDGIVPVGELLQRSDGVLWGTAVRWSSYPELDGCGSVFALKEDGGQFGVHHIFQPTDDEDDIDGCHLRGRLLSAKDGAIYGTTTSGGAYNGGTIFRLRRVSGLSHR